MDELKSNSRGDSMKISGLAMNFGLSTESDTVNQSSQFRMTSMTMGIKNYGPFKISQSFSGTKTKTFIALRNFIEENQGALVEPQAKAKILELSLKTLLGTTFDINPLELHFEGSHIQGFMHVAFGNPLKELKKLRLPTH